MRHCLIPLAIAASVATPALAHTKLAASSPAVNAAVAPIRSLKLTFSEKVMAPMAGADVTMTAMPGMANHKPMRLNGLKVSWSPDGRTMTLTAGRPFPAGTYRVDWRAAGSDTHPMKGSYSFMVY